MKRIRFLGAPLVAIATVSLLAGCHPTAQSGAAAKQPGTSESADAGTSSCTPASRSTVAQLNGQIDTGTKIQLADTARDGDVWYLAASTTGDEQTSSGHIGVGIWATTTNPRSSNFSGTLTPVNDAALQAQVGPTQSASPTPTTSSRFDASSTAAAKARKCMLTDSNLYE